jgi:hypothetical protein
MVVEDSFKMNYLHFLLGLLAPSKAENSECIGAIIICFSHLRFLLWFIHIISRQKRNCKVDHIGVSLKQMDSVAHIVLILW